MDFQTNQAYFFVRLRPKLIPDSIGCGKMQQLVMATSVHLTTQVVDILSVFFKVWVLSRFLAEFAELFVFSYISSNFQKLKNAKKSYLKFKLFCTIFRIG